MNLDALLAHLARLETPADHTWNGWRITRITGGMNNRLYRATNGARDLAIKFTIRDARDRAGREYAALVALQRAGLAIAPRAILLERERYALPIIVQTWLDGAVIHAAPANDGEWTRLLEHYAAIHSLTPARAPIDLPRAVITAHNAVEARSRVREQIAQIPVAARPASLVELVARLEQIEFAKWDTPRIAFCRVDPNITNFVRGDARWQSVDWENAGWGDPAYEMADLIAHPAYAEVSPARWEWVIEKIGALEGDAQFAERVRAYSRVILVWWVARLARYLYDIPRGGDQRLVEPARDWRIEMQTKFARYLDLATRAIISI
jgi:thiamine kinase-like enzyme